MNESEQRTKRILFWGISACVILPGVVLAGLAIADHVRTYRIYRGWGDMPLDQRVDHLYQVGYRRDGRLGGLVEQILETTQDRQELHAAGYAAMRLGGPDFVSLLRRRAEEKPDDSTRASLIAYAAAASDRDPRLYDWLAEGARCDEPFRRVGSAVGLMRLGRVEAGPLLVEIIREGKPDLTGFAMRELAWITGPMAQAVGKPMVWLEKDAPPADAPAVDQIEQFWQDYVTVSLLNDTLGRLTTRDPEWAEMGRLIHARDQVAKWLD